jgi:DNA-binding CsgD family transcriptional regulator
VLWAVPLHWYQMHAAIVAEQLPEARRHAAVLTDVAPAGPYAAVLAAAASSWLQVLSGDIDPDTVQTAARRLHGVGLAWDAAQLPAQAAARTTDRRAMSALLTCARAVNGSLPSGPDSTRGGGEELDPETCSQGRRMSPETCSQGRSMRSAPDQAEITVAVGSGPVDAQSVLSERELEVGQLILAGLTHKQVGERLFISAKTVEHHMARIRQRLGVGTRNELFDQLRAVIEGS